MRLGFSDEKVQHVPELRDCIEAVLVQAAPMITTMMASLRASTSATRGRAAALSQNPGHRQALDTLLAEENQVRQLFVTELRSQFYARRTSEAAAQPPIRFDDFQFLDDFQIDANIEIAVAQQEVMQAVDGILPSVDSLVSSLLGMVSVQPQLNPVKPEAFVLALRATLVAQVKDDSARAALLSAAANIMGRCLEDLYKDLVQWLRSQGVEPALPAGYVTPVHKSGGKPEQSAVSRTMLTLDKLKRLLTGDFDGGMAVLKGGPRDFLHTVPSSFVALEDLKLVEPMMQRLAQRAKEAGGARLEVNLLAGDPVESRQMGRQLGSEVVRLMVENLMSEQRLLPQVRQMLKQMEPVLLQLAQDDPRFFSDRKHPARLLIERITHRSLGFPDQSAEGFAWFSKAVSNAVQVLTGTNGDAQSFARVLRKLEEGWAREDEAARKRQEEAARALLHAEQRNLLAQRFTEELTQKLQGKDVPDHVGQFLRGPWAQVLAEAQLQGVDAAGGAEGLAGTADDLIWSMQLGLTRRNRNKLVHMVPGLLLQLRQGLQLVDYPEERIPLLFDNLISVHERAFEHDQKAAEPEDVDLDHLLSGHPSESTFPAEEAAAVDKASEQPLPDSAVEGEGPASVWMGDTEASESGYVSELALNGSDPLAVLHAHEEAQQVESGTWAVADLRAGAWVEIFLQGEWVRAQLTWASPHRTLFMFVSGGGLAHSMSRRTMEQRRAQGLLRVVSAGDMVGEALDAVAQAALLNQMPQTTGPAPLS